MRRTQIYLDEVLYDYLKEESKTKKKTISDIIRENIRSTMPTNTENILKNASNAYGIWKDKEADVDAHVRAIRKDRKV